MSGLGGSRPDTVPRWRELDDAARSLAYSPSSMLDGPLDPYIERYARESAAAYNSLEVQTIAYGTAPSQTFDLVRPDRSASVPLHLFIHGGYWQELSKHESFFAAPNALSRGIAFAALDYTLAPNAGIGEVVDECLLALERLHNDAAELGIDPGRIVISGSSAGAHLAAMTALQAPAEQRPAGLILLSGIYELEPLVGTYVNDALGLTVQEAQAQSPMHANLEGFPPSFIAWGAQETDEFKRQSRHFAALLEQAGREVTQAEITGRNHFDIVHDFEAGCPLDAALGRLYGSDD